MAPETVITDKWIRASIAGTTWAASEIVLGSFLHNLKFPFSGNILTAIGIIILISISYKWNEKGLIWRAGVICAIMKTMSPSAVIFGPMVAIFTEALLMEGSVRLLGRSIPGYILGGMLAMSWNLFHKIVNFIIFYGFNIVAIYSDLLKFAQKQLDIRFDIVWLPILILLLLYCVSGFVAALIGIRAGRKLLHHTAGETHFRTEGMKIKQRAEQPVFNYSMVWLIFDFGLIITALFMFNFFPWYVWTATTLLIVLLWITRYKRALRQLSRPRFWFWFILITMTTAFVLNKMQSRSLEEGLLVGIQMNFRAIVIILGFSVLGTELYNPVIREFFLKTYFKQLPLALELSFNSLPQMVAAIPEFRIFVRNPGSVVYQILSGIDQRLAEIKSGIQEGGIIVTGAVGGGKTTRILKLVEEMKEKDLAIAGIVSLRVMENDRTIGYDILDLSTGIRVPFLRSSEETGAGKIGRFTILPEGLSAGKRALQKALHGDSKVVVIDEVGLMELDGEGWAPVFDDLVKRGDKRLIVSVRDRYTDQVVRKWGLQNYIIHQTSA
jgi:nucleoside-triphosphatase THEP1